MKIKSAALIFFLYLSFGKGFSQSSHDFVLDYSATEEEFHIKDLTAEKVNIEYRYKDEQSATPNLMMREQSPHVLGKKDLKKLKKKLKKARFWDLNAAYGAPEDQRFYLYSIHVKMGNREKTVVYRSNPEYGEAPDAFWDVAAWARKALAATE